MRFLRAGLENKYPPYITGFYDRVGILPPLPSKTFCFGAGSTKQEYFTRKDLGRGSATGTNNVSTILIAKLIYEIVKPTNESERKTKHSHGYLSKVPT
jgi:hypothetical protein